MAWNHWGNAWNRSYPWAQAWQETNFSGSQRWQIRIFGATAVDRHNFKGSLGITLECLQALWSNCRWGLVVVLLLRPLVTLHMWYTFKKIHQFDSLHESALMSGQELHSTEWPVCKCLMPSSPKRELLQCHRADSQWNLTTTRARSWGHGLLARQHSRCTWSSEGALWHALTWAGLRFTEISLPMKFTIQGLATIQETQRPFTEGWTYVGLSENRVYSQL